MLHDDRRGSGRFEPIASVRARIGRRAGVLMNLSRRGTRVRHQGPLTVGELVDVTIECGDDRFFSRARVLSCRAMAAKAGEPLIFETRCAFAGTSPEAMEVLRKFLGR